MAQKSILVADDDASIRSLLKQLLTDEGYSITEAATGTEVVSQVGESSPDLVIMDVRMPELDGIAATREIARAAPKVGVLVLTMYDDDDSVFAAMRAGARGYLLKGSNQADVLRAIHLAAAGGATFGPAVAQRVIEFFARPRSGTPVAFPQLTDREHEILDLLAQGHPNATIAARLRISDKTVRNHVSNIFAKLAVADRAQAIVRAREAGLGGGIGPPS
jgi:DNA-binding NarL/FixJ family response regulator